MSDGALFRKKLLTLSFSTPGPLYALFRFFFRLTNGWINDFLSRYISKVVPPYKSLNLNNSMFKDLSEKQIDSIVTNIEKDGFCILPYTLPEHITQGILDFS